MNTASGLDKFIPDKNTTDQNLITAMDLLYSILDASYKTSGNCLKVQQHDVKQDIQGLYWRCKELLSRAAIAPEKTGFLAMSILEQTWTQARGLILCPLADLLSNDFSMLENAKHLERILRDNIYKQIWHEKSENYREILSRIGFDVKPNMFSDLTDITDPLLNALTFYGSNTARIYKIRHGKQPDNKIPMIARAMCRYTSEKEFIDAVMSSNQSCLLAFGAIEKTNAQITNHFEEWYYGMPGERQRNVMLNEHLTREEYLNAPADYTRAIYLCVKSGNTCWLVHTPWSGSQYAPAGDAGHEYYGGRRASYAPYQIFYKNAKPAPEGSTMLAIRQNGYLLSDLMDDMSMAWYPAFLDETIRLFFGPDAPEPKAVDLILSDEITAGSNKTGDNAIVPVRSGVPAVITCRLEIQEPDDLFSDDENIIKLFQHFDISSKSITNVPVLPELDGTRNNIQTEFIKRVRMAYLKILADNIANLNQTRWDVRRFLLNKTTPKLSKIACDAGDGRYLNCMRIVINNEPVFNPDGTPKTAKLDHWPYTEFQVKSKTKPDDGRDSHVDDDPCMDFDKIPFWLTDRTSSAPPVLWAIRPRICEDYAAMTDCEMQDLPELVQISGQLSDFYDRYHSDLPRDMTSRFYAKDCRSKKPSIYLPCLMPINICMTKRAFKLYPKIHR